MSSFRLLLVISLFMQSLCFAEQEVVQQSVFAVAENCYGGIPRKTTVFKALSASFERAKASVAQALSLGKQGISLIFNETTELQWLFLAPEIFKQLVIGGVMYEGTKHLELIIPSVPLDQLPASIKNTLIEMNAQHIPIKYIDGDGALAAFSRTIFWGRDLLLSSDAIQRFLVGHEVPHIQQKHQMKTFALFAVCFGGFMCGKKIVQKIEEQLKSMDENTYAYTSLACLKNMISLIVKNPFITYISFRTLQAYFARSCEKEADIIAATALNCAQGGIDYFKQSIIKDEMDNNGMTQESVDSFWSRYFRVFSFLGSKLNWNNHPSLETRIDYLLPLAQQQAIA
jgi:hypothetical protein